MASSTALKSELTQRSTIWSEPDKVHVAKLRELAPFDDLFSAWWEVNRLDCFNKALVSDIVGTACCDQKFHNKIGKWSLARYLAT